MNGFKKLSLGTKLVSAFIFVCCISIVIGVVGITNMSTISDMADRMYDRDLIGLSLVKEANINMLYIARAEKNFLLAASKEDRQKHKDRAVHYVKAYTDYLQKAKSLFVTERGKELFAKLERANQEWLKVHEQVMDMGIKEELAESRASVQLSGDLGRQKMDVVDDLMTDLVKAKEANAKEASDETTRIYSRAVC